MTISKDLFIWMGDEVKPLLKVALQHKLQLYQIVLMSPYYCDTRAWSVSGNTSFLPHYFQEQKVKFNCKHYQIIRQNGSFSKDFLFIQSFISIEQKTFSHECIHIYIKYKNL